MAIPDYQTIMLPLLKFASDQKEHSIHEAIKILSEQFKLSETDRKELLPSGQQEVFVNRVGCCSFILQVRRRGCQVWTTVSFCNIVVNV